MSLIPTTAPLAATGISLELRTFIWDGHPDIRGISCVVTNNSARAVSAWTGYDGERNRLVSHDPQFGIALHPAKKRVLQQVTIAPGESKSLLRVSLNEIFLDPGYEGSGWRWGWAYTPPRGAPWISPVHPTAELGWQLRRRESARLIAEVELDGVRVASSPQEVRANTLRTEAVRARVRLTSAREAPVDKTDRHYEINFDVVQLHEGVISTEEQRLVLPARFAEPLLRVTGAKLDAKGERYRFDSPLMMLSLARWFTASGRTGPMMLMSYEALKGG
jgi:hypothetical protein